MKIYSRLQSAVVVFVGLSATAEHPGKLPQFVDASASSKVRFVTQASHTSQKYLLESMGGGVAIFDFDGDGWMDLFFVNGAKLQDPMPAGAEPDKKDSIYWNRLYRNNRDGTFTDVTEHAGLQGIGYGMGVAAGDYDNDGNVDLYVTGYGGNRLYHNNGDGTFSDVTAKAGLTAAGWSTSAGFFDYDRDGLLDLAVARYLQWDFSMNIWCGDRRSNMRAFCHPDVFRPATYLLFHNNGDGTFTDVSTRSEFGKAPGHGLGVAFNDSDGDGWPDVGVANDAVPQQLFRNRRDGTFHEEGLTAGVAFDDDGRTFSGMGIAFDDYDNDGAADLVVTALANQKYALFRNGGGGVYSYETGPSGLGDITLRHSGWGVSWLDYDNDGWKDLFVAQSHVMDNIEQTEPGLHYAEKPLLARNVAGRFTDVSAGSGKPFQEAMAARGSAVGDLNNDGFEDLVINCNDCGAKILMNGGNGNHWLTVNTVGTVSNRDGLGARVHLVSEAGKQQWAYVTRAGSYLSSNDKRVHFGLGAEQKVRLLEIKWPSGIVQRILNVDADQMITAREPASNAVGNPVRKPGRGH